MIFFEFEEEAEMTNDQWVAVNKIISKDLSLNYEIEDHWYDVAGGGREWSIVLWRQPDDSTKPRTRFHIHMDGEVMLREEVPPTAEGQPEGRPSV